MLKVVHLLEDLTSYEYTESWASGHPSPLSISQRIEIRVSSLPEQIKTYTFPLIHVRRPLTLITNHCVSYGLY